MILCPVCQSEMIWENDYDLGEGLFQSDYYCEDEEECGVSVSIYQRKGEQEEEE